VKDINLGYFTSKTHIYQLIASSVILEDHKAMTIFRRYVNFGLCEPRRQKSILYRPGILWCADWFRYI